MWASKLKDTLEKLMEQHQALLTLAESKRLVLIEGRIKELGAIVQEETQRITLIQKLELERQNIVSSFFSSQGKPAESMNMLDLIQFIDEPKQRVGLGTLRNQLQSVILQLKGANELNQQLLQQSMEFVKHTLDLYRDAVEETGTYHHPMQQAQTNQTRHFFDSKI